MSPPELKAWAPLAVVSNSLGLQAHHQAPTPLCPFRPRGGERALNPQQIGGFRIPADKGGFALLIFTFQSHINNEYHLLWRISILQILLSMLRCLASATSLCSLGLLCQVRFIFFPPNISQREGALEKGKLRLLMKNCLLLREGRERLLLQISRIR